MKTINCGSQLNSQGDRSTGGDTQLRQNGFRTTNSLNVNEKSANAHEQVELDNLSHAETTSVRRKFETSHSQSNIPTMVKNSDGSLAIQMDIMAENSGFYVRWTDLNYTVRPNLYQRIVGQKEKTILNKLNGFFLSGELIAFMGPSGAGKTTLLDCLCLKNKTGVTGDIKVVGKPKIRIAVVPQYDEFLPQFTVTETIFFASRYKNRTYDISHRNIVKQIIQQLGLEVCQNNSIIRCSGGQRKRVAIAQELVKKPNILILDEPTSGLDSSSCSQTIGVLRQIIDLSSASTPMSIVTTIHQPSAKVMAMFDRVYLLASGGRLAFNGPPSEIIPILERVDSPCPPFYNPIDHLVEVVAGDYGRDKVDSLIRLEAARRVNFNQRTENVSAQPLRKAILYDPCPFRDHVWIHIQRSTIQLLRDPILFSLRTALHFLLAFFFAFLWGTTIGNGTACPSFNKQSISAISVSISANLTKDEKHDLDLVSDNLIFSVYGGMFTMYAATMITVLSFPLDIKVLSREYFNGWYSVTTYLVGKITSDAPFQILCVLMFALISYLVTGQPSSDYQWRFAVYAYCLICLSLISQTQGLIVGAIFMHNLSASVFVGPLTITPIYLFSGFARRYSRTAEYLKPVIKMSYFHHAVKTIYGAMYGFKRCKCNPDDYQMDLDEVDYEDIGSIKTHLSPALSLGSPGMPLDMTNGLDSGSSSGQLAGETSASDRIARQVYIGQYRCDDSFQSLVMTELGIEDDDVYLGMLILMCYLVVLRGIVLVLVKYKVAR